MAKLFLNSLIDISAATPNKDLMSVKNIPINTIAQDSVEMVIKSKYASRNRRAISVHLFSALNLEI
jgi:hypothetical protein